MKIKVDGIYNRRILVSMACEIFKRKCAMLDVESNDYCLGVASADIEKIIKVPN